MATYHRAIIEQSSGERPYVTAFDPYYGDVTQQGIQIDKLTATSSFSELWPAVSNYDPTQSAGVYLMSSVGGQIGDAAYTTGLASRSSPRLPRRRLRRLPVLAGRPAGELRPASTHRPGLPRQPAAPGPGSAAWAVHPASATSATFVHTIARVAVQLPELRREREPNCHPCTGAIADCTWDPRAQQVEWPNILTQSNRYNIFQGPDGPCTYASGATSRAATRWILADRDQQQRDLHPHADSWTHRRGEQRETTGSFGASALRVQGSATSSTPSPTTTVSRSRSVT